MIKFSIKIEQEEKDGIWKKKLTMPSGWQKLRESKIVKSWNGLGMLTGEINGIIVIDIDNIEDWERLLEEKGEKEPETLKVRSGNGGRHLYFKYEEELSTITSRSKCFGEKYEIDVRTNGGCIIIPPSKYYNKNIEKEVKYEYIEEKEICEMPNWMKGLLLNKKEIKKEVVEIVEDEEVKEEIEDEEVEKLCELLSKNRAEDYNSWIEVGMCLKNINQDYKYIWKKFSQKSEKYNSKECDEKWKSFKKMREGLKLGSLLKWCKEDNEKECKEIIEKRRLNSMIMTKYPKENLKLGKIREISEVCKYIDINNENCLFKGGRHEDMNPSMYIEILSGFITAKCKHPECFGQVYCGHKQLTKQETNYIFSGNVVNININKDEELVEFQRIDLFEDEELNELVFNGLNGEAYPFAKIIFYHFGDVYNYGEDNNWYVYESHKWKNTGTKNPKLRDYGHEKIKEIYNELLDYYKKKENEKIKIKTIRQIIKSLDNTGMKNNIMTELIDLYCIKRDKYKNGKFIDNLDNNNNLIGFENGIYDLEKMEFREGKPEDLVTITTGYEYSEKYTNKHKDLLKFLEDIQPNKEERDYMLTYLSIGLFGNLLELFTILTGSGRNGKSKIIELLGETLGEYFGSVQSQMFTRPRPDANAPDPGLLSLAKKRIIISSEPEKNSKLNSGFIKFITGRDSTTLRNCHSNDMVKFTAKFITLFICNDIPECDNIDNAFSKRLRCINFPTEFVDNPTKENQKKNRCKY